MKCTQCENAIYDSIWGEYKCSVYKRSVVLSEIANCEEYKKGTPRESKDFPDGPHF